MKILRYCIMCLIVILACGTLFAVANLKRTSVMRHKSLYIVCHSGLDPESSLFAFLDSCFSASADQTSLTQE